MTAPVVTLTIDHASGPALIAVLRAYDLPRGKGISDHHRVLRTDDRLELDAHIAFVRTSAAHHGITLRVVDHTA